MLLACMRLSVSVHKIWLVLTAAAGTRQDCNCSAWGAVPIVAKIRGFVYSASLYTAATKEGLELPYRRRDAQVRRSWPHYRERLYESA